MRLRGTGWACGCGASACRTVRKQRAEKGSAQDNDIDVLETIVYPMCCNCKDKEIFHFSDSQDATNMAFDIINTIREEWYD